MKSKKLKGLNFIEMAKLTKAGYRVKRSGEIWWKTIREVDAYDDDNSFELMIDSDHKYTITIEDILANNWEATNMNEERLIRGSFYVALKASLDDGHKVRKVGSVNWLNFSISAHGSISAFLSEHTHMYMPIIKEDIYDEWEWEVEE